MELVRKRNKKRPSRSDSVAYRRSVLGNGSSDMPLLEYCHTLWNNLEETRQRRARAMRMVYGDQWGDLITIKGKTMTQRDYITSVGNVALQTNQLKKIVQTIQGVYVKQNNEASCRARAREEQVYGELMTTALQANWQVNDLPLLIDENIKEVLVGGFTAVRETCEYRNGEFDTYTDACNPNYLFFDSNMIDPRYEDMEVIGEIHDLPFGRFCEKFAKSRQDVEKFARWYGDASSPMYCKMMEDINDKHDESTMTFFTPKDRNLLRVFEVWRKESRDRYRVHDENTGELYVINADDYQSIHYINEENKRRMALAAGQGWSEDEIPLIHYRENFFVDTYWYGRFMTPTGEIIWEGPSPYEGKKHPYSLLILPMANGRISSYLSDAIDQNIAINRMLTLHDWMMRAGLKGVTYVPADMIPDGMTEEDFAEQFTTIDGVVFYKPKPHGLKPETFYGHTGSLNLAEIVRMMSDLMDSSVSVNDAVRGEGVKSGTAAALYAQQVENSSTPIASLMMRIGVFVKHIAKQKLENIRQFYTPQKFAQIAGRLSDAVDTSKIEFDIAGNIEYDLSVAQSQATPVYRALKTDILLQFAQAGFIPPRFVFEFGDIPGADEILQRLDAMAQSAEDQQVGPDYEQKKQMLTAPME